MSAIAVVVVIVVECAVAVVLGVWRNGCENETAVEGECEISQ